MIDECGPGPPGDGVGKGKGGVMHDGYSRLDLDVRRSPLSDKFLTTLHDLRIPHLLVSQPRPERATATEAERIAIKGGWRRQSSEEEKGADDEDGSERREG